ncbi:hypothetical protein BX600DRAFT_439478 [Xylariales sp. PMI_506]|nr:hypothetical protein BX600DRAFT_439478 [Xylariales sp. PMI_506]
MDTCTCLCSSVRRLAENYDEGQAKGLIPALNSHLGSVRTILAESKSLQQQIQYRITLHNQRTVKALSLEAVDTRSVDQVCRRFEEDIERFWTHSDDPVHTELRRRLSCVVIFLRSQLASEVLAPPQIACLFQGQPNYQDLRNAGRKYIKISRKLGGLGSIVWLPLDIPASTYERYLNIDDEDVFNHLNSLDPQIERYADFVQQLILSQLRYPLPTRSRYNLVFDYSDVITASDWFCLLLHALGGSGVPDIILKSVCIPQRRWNASGEIESISAINFGLPLELVNFFTVDTNFNQAMSNPQIVRQELDNGIVMWSLCPELESYFNRSLLPQTIDQLRITALRLICFACPPCYEGNTSWSASLKRMVWPLLEKTARKTKIPTALRIPVLEAALYFAERDSVNTRLNAITQARTLLRKSMPYYLHASVVLFQSVLYRLDGDLAKSEGTIHDFLSRSPQPSTRRDYALQGRLHISQIENKIRYYDNDVPSFIYQWEAEQPLSTLDIEVTSRLQTAAARFFQSIGDFRAARASLEQFLSLDTAIPIRVDTRRLIVGRLADIYCEMKEYSEALELLQPELENIKEFDRPRRPFRRLLLASVEANIGLNRLDTSESVLKELGQAVPLELDSLHDQQLHMRSLLAAARIAHLKEDHDEAVRRWSSALHEVGRMYALKSTSGFTAAMIYLSMAHAQLTAGDRSGGRHSWASGIEILRTEKCEFWIPIIATGWLHRVAIKVHELQGWPLRMMLPGGKPDIVWP